MNRTTSLTIVTTATLSSAWATTMNQKAGSNPFTFFVTSMGSGNGADLGGLAGADRRCQELAQAAGAGDHMARVSKHYRRRIGL